jgi:hypothetical protein
MELLKRLQFLLIVPLQLAKARKEKVTTMDYLPIGVRYKGKQVAAYWCKDSKGNYVR